jgi:hypothetical protein
LLRILLEDAAQPPHLIEPAQALRIKKPWSIQDCGE